MSRIPPQFKTKPPAAATSAAAPGLAPSAPAAPLDPSATIVARASTEYRVKRYLIVAMLIGMGAWFGYDGLVAWPKENARIDEINKERAAARDAKDEPLVVRLNDEERKLQRHSDSDLRLQRVLCYTLPPAGLLVLAWALYRSRGSLKLANLILTAPGHPPVPLDAIRSIDKTYWDRKGIAYVNYELANGQTGSLTLDDFIYDRQPTDDIFRRIEDYTGTAEVPPATAG
jgi:hypothetical protein